MTSEIVRYKADNGQDIEVTEQDVRDLMAANGNAMENVTSQEVKMFLRLCQSQRLNPFTRDAYIVKYGNQPASVIAGKDAFVKRATRNKKYRGHEAGITVIGTDGKMHRREGSMLLEGETLVGGWAKVHLEGYECPIFEEVALKEYAAPDKYGKNGWSRMPATMIRKVALCHALREAFPEDLGGLYGAEEMDQATPQQTYEEPAVESVETVREEPIAEAARQQPAPSAMDAYRAALTRAKRERGIPIAEAMARVRAVIDKDPADYDEADIAAAVTIVDGLAQEPPEPEYEMVEAEVAEAPLPLSDNDIPF